MKCRDVHELKTKNVSGLFMYFLLIHLFEKVSLKKIMLDLYKACVISV